MTDYKGEMRRFGESVAQSSGPAVYQPGDYINVWVRSGIPCVEIDVYTAQRGDPYADDFDVDQWDNEKLFLESPVGPGRDARRAWKHGFGLARGLLAGYAAEDDSGSFTLQSYCEARRAARPELYPAAPAA